MMRFRLFWIALVFALTGGALLYGVVSAQGVTPPPPSDDQVNAVAKQLYCPVCENIPLDVCPTTACARWRGVIREKLAAGWDEAQIKDYFVTQYGDRVLAEPPRRGLNWLVYILPPVSILIGAVIVWRVLRGMRAHPAPVAPTPPASAPQQTDYVSRVEEELKKRE